MLLVSQWGRNELGLQLHVTSLSVYAMSKALHIETKIL